MNILPTVRLVCTAVVIYLAHGNCNQIRLVYWREPVLIHRASIVCQGWSDGICAQTHSCMPSSLMPCFCLQELSSVALAFFCGVFICGVFFSGAFFCGAFFLCNRFQRVGHRPISFTGGYGYIFWLNQMFEVHHLAAWHT